ncbi:HEAT repeat domain-containing protein [Marinicella sp. S1101]|uniref:HEAT repeat domain-containing protein n=1 Tax=Marinicella marina TaxID=2996016 RepID=UPI002260DBAF|nr:HEAT repeat domain-containing protein [Marinicella marina]MCX7552994.1 HEAT repeat domain-containing protein [Marinicella marina]
MKNNNYWVFLWLCLILCSWPIFAGRYISMHDAIKMSTLIVLAEVIEDENNTLHIKVKKILKGNDLTTGQVVSITHPPMVFSGSYLELGKNIVVLFDEGWQEVGRRWPVFRSYSGEEADQVVSLLKYALIKNERKRLKKLIGAYGKDNYTMSQLLLDEISSMQNPQNFDLFNSAFLKISEPTDSEELLEIMAETRDLRSIPILIAALSSSHSDVRSTAAHELRYAFAGAAGVDEAFERHFDDPDVQYHAKAYLKKRYQHPKYRDEPNSKTPWLQFITYRDMGKISEALEVCVAILKSHEWNSYTSPICAEFTVKFSEGQYDEIVINHFFNTLPPLNELTTHGVRRLAQIAWQVETKNKTMLPLLLDLLAYKDYNVLIFALATMSINQLDAESKKVAVEKIFSLVDSTDSLSSIKLALGIGLLGDKEQLKKIKRMIYEKTYMRFAIADEYADIKQAADPATWLITELRKTHVDSKYIEWLIIHLDVLNDERTELVMYELLQKYSHYDLQTAIHDVLSQHSNLNLKILVETLESAQMHAKTTLTRLLIQHGGQNSLDHIRAIIRGDLNGDVSQALSAIGRMGELEDIKLLQPYCNHWPKSGQRYNWQYCDALDSVRRVNNYDLSGPIVKTAKMTPFD